MEKQSFEITNEKGTYIVAELKEPNGDKTYDIMVVFRDGDKLEMLDYMYGVSLMSDDEIMAEALDIIERKG